MHQVHFTNPQVRLDKDTWRRENRLDGWTYFLWLTVSSGARMGPEHRECTGSNYGRQEGASWYDTQIDRQTKTERHHAWRGLWSRQIVSEERQRVFFYSEVFEAGSPGENATGDQNQKTAITSQMALTLNGFERKFQLMNVRLGIVFIWYTAV